MTAVVSANNSAGFLDQRQSLGVDVCVVLGEERTGRVLQRQGVQSVGSLDVDDCRLRKRVMCLMVAVVPIETIQMAHVVAN